MTAIEVDKPAVVILDVALPSMYGFEICESVRRNPALDGVKLILVASIYDKTRYKRAPSTLYGADAYIEKHHMPDSLAALIYRLVGGEQAGKGISDDTWDHLSAVQSVEDRPSVAELTEQESTRKALIRDEECLISVSADTAGLVAGEETEAYVKARRLARIIVSDILLYNQAKVEEGVRNGTFFELLSEEIKEGRALFARRVAQGITPQTAFLDEAFDMLIAGKRQEMNL
jgi:response regulator RpfG family c-di-GMP phosphodiesterase